jgi:hypothetical protein
VMRRPHAGSPAAGLMGIVPESPKAASRTGIHETRREQRAKERLEIMLRQDLVGAILSNIRKSGIEPGIADLSPDGKGSSL